MIDIERESLVSIRDVPRQIPPRRSGRRVHISAVYRWLGRGVRGVKLEAIKIGGTTYTSLEALQRFAERLSEPSTQPRSGPTSSTRKRQIDRAAEELRDALGAADLRTSHTNPDEE